MTNNNITDAETVSEIGQITAHFLYKNNSNVYKNVDYIPFNSGGSLGGRFASGLETLTSNGVDYNKMPKGTAGGEGMAEVITSAELSCSKICWKDGYVVWSEQDLFNGNSIIHFFTFDGKFNPSNSIIKPFEQDRTSTIPSTAKYVGEGFGLDFKYEDRLFITNALDDKDEGGNLIRAASGQEGHYIDQLFIYELLRNKDAFSFSQKIIACIDESREDYYSEYFKSPGFLIPKLLPLQNAFNYDNNSLKTSAWDIDLTNRYDISGKKIILKDALEYAVFDRDYSNFESFSISENQTSLMSPYLGVSENTTLRPTKSQTSLSYQYISQTDIKDPISCRNTGMLNSGDDENKTPILYYWLDIDDLTMVDSVTISFDILNQDIFSSFSSLGALPRTDSPNNLIPRCVLYGKDPRMTIIDNGPAETGTETQVYPRYENGIFTRPRWDAGEGIDYYADMFPGYYRGGAQDLFFYSRLPGSVIKSGKSDFPSRDSLSYLFGGNVNLGEYFDLTIGRRNSGSALDGNLRIAGDPAWIAPDVYQEFDSSETQYLLPYAKIFEPNQVVSDQPLGALVSYSVTLSAEDVRNFAIKGNVIRDTSRRSTVITNSSSGFNDFNDSANTYDFYTSQGSQNVDLKGAVNHTLAIGFLLTNVNSFNVETGQITHTEGSTNFNTGPLRYIRSTDKKSFYPDARYPYAKSVYYYYPTPNGAKVNQVQGRGLLGLQYDLSAKIRNPRVEVSTKKLLSRRYKNSFHKIAAFNYIEQERDEVRKSYLSQDETKIYSAFGVDRFIPVPESDAEPITGIGGATASDFKNVTNKKSNPIISISESLASSESNSLDRGSFSKSLQIINTQNAYRPRGTFEGASSIYIDDETGGLRFTTPPTGHVLGDSFFENNILFGGFDIQSPEYLGLFINSNPSEALDMDLLVLPHGLFNKDADLVTRGFTSSQSDADLWIGVKQFNEDMPLFAKVPDIEAGASLFTFEVAPSATTPLFVSGPDATGNITLTITPPKTKTADLFALGPVQDSGNFSLFSNGHAHANLDTSLNISGVFFGTGIANLYTEASVLESGSINLAMNPTYSGSIPLYINKHPDASGEMPLFAPSPKVPGTGATDLFIGDQFSLENRSLTTFIMPQRFASGNATLYQKGKSTQDVNSLRDTEVDIAVSLSDGLFDRGQRFAGTTFSQYNEDPITQNIGGEVYNSNSVLANVLFENIYSRNIGPYRYDTRNTGLWFMSSAIRGESQKIEVEETPQGNTVSNVRLVTDPAQSQMLLSNSQQSPISPYYESNSLIGENFKSRNYTIKQEAYDVNDDFLVKASVEGNVIEVGFYNVEEDGSVRQPENDPNSQSNPRNFFRFAPALGPDEPNDFTVAFSFGSANDPFVELREDILDLMNDQYFPLQTNGLKASDYNFGQAVVNDLKISSGNKCAISFRVRVGYNNPNTLGILEGVFNVVLVFRIGGYKGPFAAGGPFPDESDYNWIILPELGNGPSKSRSGYSVAFDYQDVYFSRSRGGNRQGEVWRIKSSDGYRNPEKVVTFAELDDAGYYNSNAAFINQDDRKAGFGSTIKIFD